MHNSGLNNDGSHIKERLATYSLTRKKNIATACIDIITPVYNEEQNIPLFYERLTKVLKNIGIKYRILFVNDGSQDNSPLLLDHFVEIDPHVGVIHLSRNFGHQQALFAGLQHSTGECVIFLDSDLQDPPEEIKKMVHLWLEGYDVVYAVRTKRKEPFAKRLAYKLFYLLLRKISNIEMPLDSGDFSLIDGKAVQYMKQSKEVDIYLRGLRSWIGFTQIEHLYERGERHAGTSQYSLPRLFKLALSGICGYSHLPLTLSFYFGIVFAFLSILYAAYILVLKILYGIDLRGWTSTVLLITLMGSIQFMLIGITNYYIGIILRQVQERPSYIVREKKGNT